MEDEFSKEGNCYVLINNYVKNTYFTYDKFKNTNSPFTQEVQIGNKRLTALSDTGADVSLINLQQLTPKQITKVRAQKYKVQSASGDYLNIIGRIEHFKIKIEGKEYRLDALVIKGSLKGTILGQKFITEHPEILEKKLQKYCNKIEVENTINEQEIKNKYKDIFKDQIN